MSNTQEQVDYPLPVIHMNGTGAEDLMAGYENIYDCLNKLQSAMEKCIVHARDYYPQDNDFSKASCLNAAAGLIVEEKFSEFSEAYNHAREFILSGKTFTHQEKIQNV